MKFENGRSNQSWAKQWMLLLTLSPVVLMGTGCLESESLSTGSSADQISKLGEAPLSEEELLLNEVLLLLRDQETLLKFNDDRIDEITSLDTSPYVTTQRFVASAQTQAMLTYPRAYEMKISQGSLCEEGQWQLFQRSVPLVLTQLNAKNYFSVQVRDPDKLTSACESFSIVHDSVGPEVTFQKYPQINIDQGAQSEIVFDIFDQTGIAEVECRLDAQVVECQPDVSIKLPSDLSLGEHTFTVIAKDGLGSESSTDVKWNVNVGLVAKTLQQRVNEDRKVDILFIVDNSGSMAYEQRSMATRIGRFIQNLEGLDWQIGVTTTDPRATAFGGDGKLVPIKGYGNNFLLNSLMDKELAQTYLGNTLQMSTNGYHLEQGIFATYRNIERAVAASQSAEGMLIRPGAAFAAVVISDEDESANTLKNDPQKLVDLVGSSFAGQKNFSYHSIVSKPGDQACLQGEGATIGHRYAEMSRLTGGILGSVCETDYGSQLSGIGNSVRQSQNSLTLGCEPIGQIEVIKDGMAYSETYIREGIRLRFSSVLPAGDYTVNYSCLAGN